MNSIRQWSILSVILIAAIYRVIPHPYNFTPVIAMALFAGAKLENRSYAVVIPLASMFISDWILGFHNTMIFVYGALAICVLLGRFLNRFDGGFSSLVNLSLATISASMLFYIVTNFGVWWLSGIYRSDWNGLVESYLAALPFFQNSLLGNLFFSGLFFIGFYLAEKKYPQYLKPQEVS